MGGNEFRAGSESPAGAYILEGRISDGGLGTADSDVS
jgi:hypothetical protein